MRKAKALRITGFVGALCASAALVGTSVSGTGAYFTDSHDGNINASTGGISVTVTPADGQLNFTNLLPGDYQTQPVSWTAHPNGGTEDIWLVFPNYGASNDAFTAPAQPGPAPLGAYGHFAVSAPAGTFTSYNLANPAPGSTNQPACTIDANGHGGSAAQLSAPPTNADQQLPYCAPARAILLQSNLGNGDTGQANITFGFTPMLQSAKAQNSPVGSVEQYQIVATQHGIRPDNPFNG